MSLFGALGRRISPDTWLWSAVGVTVATTFGIRLAENRRYVPDYDDGVYWQTGRAIAAGAEPYRQVFHAQPPLLAWLLSAPFRLAGPAAAIGVAPEMLGRCMMVAFALVLTGAAGAIASTLAGPRAGAFAAVVTALLPLVQRYSYQFGSDLPASALAAVALWCALKTRTRESQRWWSLVSGALFGLALLSKLNAVLVLPALAVTVGSAAGRSCLRRRGQALLWMVPGLCLVVAAVLLLLRPPREAWRQVLTFHFHAIGAVWPDSASSGAASDLLASLGVWMMVFGVLATVAAVFAVVTAARSDRPAVVAIALWGAAFGPFIAFYQPVFEHHLLMFVVPGAVLVGTAVATAWRRWATGWPWLPRSAVVVLCLICLLVTLLTQVSKPFTRITIERCVAGLPSDYVLVTDDQELVARAGLRTPPWLVDTSRVRVQAGYLSDVEIIMAAGEADGVLLAPRSRARIRSEEVVDWATAHFPAHYKAGGYDLYVRLPEVISDCPR